METRVNIVLEFLTGVKVGIEFPGDGYHCVVDLFILRIYFMSDEALEKADE